ncbi:MAG TPA: GGDEF domain-containing protein [Rhodospirillaceae bacterium]|nr:GGDEF domain-containing protein [Rhodospirillaceae bacterium]
MKPSKVASRLESILDGINVTFQAIANIHTGRCFGCEVLLRGHEALGYPTVADMFDFCHTVGALAEVEVAVLGKAVNKLARLEWNAELRLFVPLDSRLLPEARAFQKAIRQEIGDHYTRLVMEVDGGTVVDVTSEWVKALKKHGALIAADRFGSGKFSQQLLHEVDPDFVKLSPFFVTDIDSDRRKRVALSQMVATAHTLGMQVIATGVQTERENLALRELGCDMVQGVFVQKPVNDPLALEATYAHLAAIGGEYRRRRTDQEWIAEQLDGIAPVLITESMSQVFERLANEPGRTLIPVVDKQGQPLGVVVERKLKNFAYSVFGKDLIANKGIGRTLQNFLSHCPIAEISSSLQQILASFSTAESADGVIITENGHYLGFLSAPSIIRAIHERTLSRARDENPLTKLPGNDLIAGFVTECFSSGQATVLAYIDFDNFKPFNDTYGFRQGDRAILLFADLMRRETINRDWFIGHIGGDDFFIGMRGGDQWSAMEAIGKLVEDFSSDAESFYDQAARENRCISAKDRDGTIKCFPLLSASAVLVGIPAGSTDRTVDEVSALIAAKKKDSKTSPNKMVFAVLEE